VDTEVERAAVLALEPSHVVIEQPRGDGWEVVIRDARTGRPRGTVPLERRGASATRDDRLVLADGGTVTVYDLSTGEPLGSRAVRGEISDLALSEGRVHIAVDLDGPEHARGIETLDLAEFE
jgi:hypothetical protein